MNYDYSWTIDPGTDIIKVSLKGTVIMRIYLGEAMETAGRKIVVDHVKECDRSPWLPHWGAREAIMEALSRPEDDVR